MWAKYAYLRKICDNYTHNIIIFNIKFYVNIMKTKKQQFIDKYNLNNESYNLNELSDITEIPIEILIEVYNRGIGAYYTNPTSVRTKDFKKINNTSKSNRLSPQQWAYARVYSFLMDNKKHDRDLHRIIKLLEIGYI